MDTIYKKLNLDVPVERAFEIFLTELRHWWPKAYTWSKGKLEDIKVSPNVGGHCTEIGPGGFSIDWGTVTEIQKDKLISFRWQIGLYRDPIPDHEKASLVAFAFSAGPASGSLVECTHSDFKKHGKDHLAYLKAMDSKEGWEAILECYKAYVEK